MNAVIVPETAKFIEANHKKKWQGFRPFPYFSNELTNLDHFVYSPFFLVRTFFLQSCSQPAPPRALSTTVPQFFAWVFPWIPVARRLRFNHLCRLSSLPNVISAVRTLKAVCENGDISRLGGALKRQMACGDKIIQRWQRKTWH